jgi:hypothetical protein
MKNKIHYDHLGQPITIKHVGNRSLYPEVYSSEAKAAGVRPTGVVEGKTMRATAVPHIPIQEPTVWVKRRKLVTARNPQGVERGPSRMTALPHNLARRPLGRRPARG